MYNCFSRVAWYTLDDSDDETQSRAAVGRVDRGSASLRNISASNMGGIQSIGGLNLPNRGPKTPHNQPSTAIMSMSLERAMTRLSLRPASVCRECRRTFTSPAKPRQQQSAVGAIAGLSISIRSSKTTEH